MNFRDRLTKQRRLPRNEELLMGRASLLLSKDRDLVEAVFVKGQSLRAIARMTGKTAKSVRQRIGRISRILTSRMFLETARSLPFLTDSEASLARKRFCACVSQRTLAKDLGISLTTLRRRLDRIQAQVQTLSRLRKLMRNGLRPSSDQAEQNPAFSAPALLEAMERSDV